MKAYAYDQGLTRHAYFAGGMHINRLDHDPTMQGPLSDSVEYIHIERTLSVERNCDLRLLELKIEVDL